MNKTMNVEIVSLESKIFSGTAEALFITGTLGEMGIYPGHAPLFSSIKPGQIRLQTDNKQEIFYVEGGLLEVQPKIVTILADTVVRAGDLDEAKAKEAEQRARQVISERTSEVEYSQALSELARAVAQLQAIKKIREKYKV